MDYIEATSPDGEVYDPIMGIRFSPETGEFTFSNSFHEYTFPMSEFSEWEFTVKSLKDNY